MEKELKEIIEILLKLPEPKYLEAKKEMFVLKRQKVRDLFMSVFTMVEEKREKYKGAEG